MVGLVLVGLPHHSRWPDPPRFRLPVGGPWVMAESSTWGASQGVGPHLGHELALPEAAAHEPADGHVGAFLLRGELVAREEEDDEALAEPLLEFGEPCVMAMGEATCGRHVENQHGLALVLVELRRRGVKQD